MSKLKFKFPVFSVLFMLGMLMAGVNYEAGEKNVSFIYLIKSYFDDTEFTIAICQFFFSMFIAMMVFVNHKFKYVDDNYYAQQLFFIFIFFITFMVTRFVTCLITLGKFC